MAEFQGVHDLVSAFTGGSSLEDAAYWQQAKRILDAKSEQALMDKRVQEAYAAKRQNEYADRLPNIVASVLTGREDPNAPFNPNEQASLINAFVGSGNSLVDTTSGIGNIIENALRAAAYQAAGQEGFTPFNQATATIQGKPIPTLDRQGDVLLRGQMTANPEVDQIASALNAAFGASADKSGGKGVREQKIKDAMQLYNMDRATAVAFVDKYITQDINEYTGNVVRQNLLPEGAVPLPGYGPATEIPIQGGTSDMPPPQPLPGESLYELAPESSGLMPSAQDLIARTVTLFGGSANMEPTMAIQTMNTAVQDMVRSLAINPRFPVSEQERILQEINIRPGWFTSPEVLQARMRSLRNSLELRAAQAERDAADPSLSRDIRKSQGDNAVMIRNFLPRLGPPQMSARDRLRQAQGG